MLSCPFLVLARAGLRGARAFLVAVHCPSFGSAYRARLRAGRACSTRLPLARLGNYVPCSSFDVHLGLAWLPFVAQALQWLSFNTSLRVRVPRSWQCARVPRCVSTMSLSFSSCSLSAPPVPLSFVTTCGPRSWLRDACPSPSSHPRFQEVLCVYGWPSFLVPVRFLVRV